MKFETVEQVREWVEWRIARLPPVEDRTEYSAGKYDILCDLLGWLVEAQVGRNAKRQDAEERLGPQDEHAVPERNAQ